MYYLKNLILSNFQKHSKLELEFTSGVNIIHGKSDVGKSCIRRALDWVTGINTPDGLRKQGSKQTSVKAILSNGIEIERIRSKSVNRFVITKDGEEKVYDAIGRDIPEEVKEELKIYPIEIDGENIFLNSAPQLSLPFLFDKSPIVRHKLFNKLTGNDVLDNLFVKFNKDILSIKKETKREDGHFEELKEEIEELEIKKEQLEAVYERFKKRIERIKNQNAILSKLLEIKDLIKKNAESITIAENKFDSIKVPETINIKELREKSERFDTLKTLQNTLESTISSLTDAKVNIDTIRLPDFDFQRLITKNDRLLDVKKTYEDIDKCTDQCYTLSEKLGKLEYLIDAKEMDCKELLKNIKICPTCHQEIKND